MIRCEMCTVNRFGLGKFPVPRDPLHVGKDGPRAPGSWSSYLSPGMACRSSRVAKSLVARGFRANTRKCAGVFRETNDDARGDPRARLRLRQAGFAPGVIAPRAYRESDEWTAICRRDDEAEGPDAVRRRHRRPGPRFSTVSVRRRCTSLWTTPAAPFADSHLPRVDDFLRSGAAVLHSACGACRAKPVDKMPICLTAKDASTAWANFARTGAGSAIAACGAAVAYTGLFIPLEVPR